MCRDGASLFGAVARNLPAELAERLRTVPAREPVDTKQRSSGKPSSAHAAIAGTDVAVVTGAGSHRKHFEHEETKMTTKLNGPRWLIALAAVALCFSVAGPHPAAAKELGLPLSAWIRLLVRDKLGMPTL